MNAIGFRNAAESGINASIESWATQTIGAALEVFEVLGSGLPEVAYREALSEELTLRGVPHVCEASVPIYYKGRKVAEGRIDILVADVLVVELKVVEALNPLHTAQVVSYLSAMRLGLRLLFNFNVVVFKDGIKRVIRSR